MNKDYQILFIGFIMAVFACALGTLLLCGGCASPLVDMRRIYVVPMYGAGDNIVTVPVGGVEHANTIEAKVADRLTGVQGAEISGNSASAGVQKGAVNVKGSLK